MENKDKLAKLTLEEKASLLVGNKNMETKAFPSIDLKPLILSDGPNGIRKEQAQKGAFSAISKTLPATCFPSDNMLASSWNASLLHEVGVALGKEAKFYDVNILLGPAINIQRNPLCGRNFEYYSEDTLLAGEMASAYINGVQSENVYSCVKHFACNNNEKWRFVGDSLVDERALH
jgi:beta-glucosidase